jgi:hypothetical protein
MYTTPPRWTHGDYPTAGAMNIYSNDLDYLHGLAGAARFAVPRNSGDINQRFYRRWRWLWYETAGQAAEIIDPSGTEDEYDLPRSDGAMAPFDLSQIPWLTVGRVYEIKHARYACEEADELAAGEITTGAVTVNSGAALATTSTTDGEDAQRAWFG